jgi:hypothetical protein
MSVKKRIRKQKAEKVLARLNEIPNLTLSIREFVSMNFDTLQQSGKSLKVLYYFLSNNGIDVGTCESFKAIYNSVKHAQKLNA